MSLLSGSSSASSLLLAAPSALALVGYGVASWPRDPSPRLGHGLRWLLLAAWIAHGVAIAIDASGVGSGTIGTRFGFAPALSVTAWLVLAVYAIEVRFVDLNPVHRALALVGLQAVALAFVFPGEFRPHASSPFAPLHWILGIASYGLFGVAVLHATMLDRADRRLRLPRVGAANAPAGMPLLGLERLTFGFVTAGFAALTAAILLGALFAQPWRWDHKTVFSCMAWLVFAALLVGRKTMGWRGQQATRWLYAGVVLLLLAYAGSRFVLEVLLNRVSTS